jgi:hypothetical protein
MARAKDIQRREAAEADKRARKAARAARARQEAELAQVRARSRSVSLSEELVLSRRLPPGLRDPEIRRLLAVVGHGGVPTRTLNLVRAVERRGGRMTREKLVALHRLAPHTERVDLEAWRPRRRASEARFRSLVQHCLVVYPVPAFLYGAFEGGERGWPAERQVRLFRFLAEGGSLRRAGDLLPPRLTRRMLGLFLSEGRVGMGLLQAARQAQALALGARPQVIRGVLGSRLGREVAPHESFVLAGRSLRSVQAAVQDWHVEVTARYERARFPELERFDLAGVGELHSTLGRGRSEQRWSLQQIDSMTQLYREGQAMRHCVYTYGGRIRSGEVSIWSLRADGRRVATVELQNRTGLVVQVRGPCNQAVSSRAFQVIERWVAAEGLRIARFVTAPE